MTRAELRAQLIAMGVREDAYDLDGGHLPERYTLADAHGNWSVYYSERGLETGKHEFKSESQACDYFLNLISRDPTTRK